MPSGSVLITGCGPGGIGSALAKCFHRHGHLVLATGRSTTEIDPELERLGIKTFSLDVADEGSISSAVATTSEITGGRLDILINNAGLLHVMPFADTPASDARRLMEVNIIGVWAVTHAFLPLLLESQGLVASMGSVNQTICPPFMAAYNASKATVEAMMRSLRRELAPLGVRAVTIKTGAVRTTLFENASGEHLPEGSLYAPIQGYIEGKEFLKASPFMDVEEYAELIAKEVTRARVKPVVWAGALVWITWLLSIFGWETIMDGPIIKGGNMHKLRYVPKTKAA